MHTDDEKLNLLGAAVGLLGLALISWDLQPWTLDDAYISFRYAENFAAGHGLVYNPGERVEGYTTFLWVVLLGLGDLLGADVRILAKLLGALCAAATVLLLAFAHRVVPTLPRPAGALAAAWLGTCCVFSAWAMPGMEVPLVALLLLGTSLTALAERPVLTGVLGALALMTRPDCIVVVGVWMLHAAWRRRWRAPAVLAALYGPYFLGRWWYYGWLLPNTFYAKVGASEAQLERGLEYLSGFGSAAGLLVLPAFFARRRPWLAVAWIAHLGFVVAVGGDVMPAFRFIATVLPLILLGAGVALASLGTRGVWGALALGIALNAWQYGHHPDLEPRIRRGVVGLRGEEVGLWLREHVDPDLVLATNTAGSVPYFSGLQTIDMLGLNDTHIAHVDMRRMGEGRAGHEKADGAYVFERAPDIVQFGSARGREKPTFRSDRELYRQPGFTERYQLVEVRLPSGASAVFWVSRQAIESGSWSTASRR